MKYLISAFLLLGIAYARDPDGLYNNSPYKDWFSSQSNALGQFCCNEADGHPYLGDYILNHDGSVTLAGGHVIPTEKVLKGPNPTGHAVWWHIDQTDYCFSPGTLG